ncbi:hypothetical protein D6C85_05602 [Aureobasidium pullulans]|uniref:Uncharacterized protein n=1 Tax=Aureobasidium pullulans TaxID=5580 RepID=A0A4S9WY35_AURPU|nr:hypothetical protein D6C85_05602 [Aureobasidium pullulans]
MESIAMIRRIKRSREDAKKRSEEFSQSADNVALLSDQLDAASKAVTALQSHGLVKAANLQQRIVTLVEQKIGSTIASSDTDIQQSAKETSSTAVKGARAKRDIENRTIIEASTKADLDQAEAITSLWRTKLLLSYYQVIVAERKSTSALLPGDQGFAPLIMDC